MTIPRSGHYPIMNVQIKVSLIISKNNAILLIKEWSNKRVGYYWNIIKGSYEEESGETIIECAERETEEEAGLKVKVSGFVSCFIFPREVGFGIQYNFLGEPVSGSNFSIPPKKEQEDRNEDIQEIKWFSKEDLLKIKPKDFISKRTRFVIDAWIEGRTYPLDTFQQLSE